MAETPAAISRRNELKRAARRRSGNVVSRPVSDLPAGILWLYRGRHHGRRLAVSSGKPGSMGTPIPGWFVRILDEDGREVPPGMAGEICLLARSNPNYPLGYWRRPDDTERDFGGMWFRTKDVAKYDADGYIWYLGRQDDVIKASGYRISPHEVEAVLRQHVAVSDAAIIGMPDADRGTRVVAFVVPSARPEDANQLAAELQAFVRERHSAYAYPREVHFVTELPRSSTGKINRALLRKKSED